MQCEYSYAGMRWPFETVSNTADLHHDVYVCKWTKWPWQTLPLLIKSYNTRSDRTVYGSRDMLWGISPGLAVWTAVLNRFLLPFMNYVYQMRYETIEILGKTETNSSTESIVFCVKLFNILHHYVEQVHLVCKRKKKTVVFMWQRHFANFFRENFVILKKWW